MELRVVAPDVGEAVAAAAVESLLKIENSIMRIKIIVSIIALLMCLSCADRRPERAEADFRKDARHITGLRIDSNSFIKVGFVGNYFVGILVDDTYVKLSSPFSVEQKSVSKSRHMVYIGAANEDDESSGEFPTVNLMERTLTVPTEPKTVYTW